MDKQPAHAARPVIDELSRHAAAVKDALAPTIWWKNPWVRLGLAVGVGFAIGAAVTRKQTANHEGILHAIVRASLAAAAAMLVKQALDPGDVTDPRAVRS